MDIATIVFFSLFFIVMLAMRYSRSPVAWKKDGESPDSLLEPGQKIPIVFVEEAEPEVFSIHGGYISLREKDFFDREDYPQPYVYHTREGRQSIRVIGWIESHSLLKPFQTVL